MNDASPGKRALRADAHPTHDVTPAAPDDPLRRTVRDLPPQLDPDRLQALQARVLAQWSEVVGERPAPAEPGRRHGAGRWRLAWVGLATAAVVVALVLQRPPPAPDPVLEELVQVDVLSLMAAGEM